MKTNLSVKPSFRHHIRPKLAKADSEKFLTGPTHQHTIQEYSDQEFDFYNNNFDQLENTTTHLELLTTTAVLSPERAREEISKVTTKKGESLDGYAEAAAVFGLGTLIGAPLTGSIAAAALGAAFIGAGVIAPLVKRAAAKIAGARLLKRLDQSPENRLVIERRESVNHGFYSTYDRLNLFEARPNPEHPDKVIDFHLVDSRQDSMRPRIPLPAGSDELKEAQIKPAHWRGDLHKGEGLLVGH